MKNLIFVGFLGTLAASCSFFGIGSEEQPFYKVMLKEDNREIRKYSSYIVARTTLKGSFEEAQKEGFRILAGYIFGKNKSQQKISMTAPVIIASDNKNWTVTFSMPTKYTLETLPTPDDKRIRIETIEARFVAALTFSGFWSESKNKEKGEELIRWMEMHKSYKLLSAPMFAGYDPPWTLPFLRRNEVLIELKGP